MFLFVKRLCLTFLVLSFSFSIFGVPATAQRAPVPLGVDLIHLDQGAPYYVEGSRFPKTDPQRHGLIGVQLTEDPTNTELAYYGRGLFHYPLVDSEGQTWFGSRFFEFPPARLGRSRAEDMTWEHVATRLQPERESFFILTASNRVMFERDLPPLTGAEVSNFDWTDAEVLTRDVSPWLNTYGALVHTVELGSGESQVPQEVLELNLAITARLFRYAWGPSISHAFRVRGNVDATPIERLFKGKAVVTNTKTAFLFYRAALDPNWAPSLYEAFGVGLNNKQIELYEDLLQKHEDGTLEESKLGTFTRYQTRVDAASELGITIPMMKEFNETPLHQHIAHSNIGVEWGEIPYLVLTVGMNLVQNCWGYEEVFGTLDGVELWNLAQSHWATYEGDERATIPHVDEFVPLWQRPEHKSANSKPYYKIGSLSDEGVRAASSVLRGTKPGKAMPWNPTTVFDQAFMMAEALTPWSQTSIAHSIEMIQKVARKHRGTAERDLELYSYLFASSALGYESVLAIEERGEFSEEEFNRRVKWWIDYVFLRWNRSDTMVTAPIVESKAHETKDKLVGERNILGEDRSPRNFYATWRKEFLDEWSYNQEAYGIEEDLFVVEPQVLSRIALGLYPSNRHVTVRTVGTGYPANFLETDDARSSTLFDPSGSRDAIVNPR